LALAAALALGVAGCGRRGALEPPPDASAVQKPAPSKGEPAARKKVPPITPPNTPFVLDPLL
jgi:predicted small lipoprotein YifL